MTDSRVEDLVGAVPAVVVDGGPARVDPRPGPSLRTRLFANRRLVVVLSLIATFGVWEWVGRANNPVLFAPPTRVMDRGWDLGSDGEFWSTGASTVRGILLGFAISAVAGVTLGLLSGRYRSVDWATSAQITWLYVTPNIVFIPLLILWFGLGLSLKLAIVVMAAVFPILITTHDGARIASEEAVDVARVEGASEWQILRKIVLPGTLPYIMTGMRLGIGKAMTGMIVAEMYTQLSGFGGMIMQFGFAFRTAELLFVIFVVGVFGWSLTAAMGLVERRFARWKFPDF